MALIKALESVRTYLALHSGRCIYNCLSIELIYHNLPPWWLVVLSRWREVHPANSTFTRERCYVEAVNIPTSTQQYEVRSPLMSCLTNLDCHHIAGGYRNCTLYKNGFRLSAHLLSLRHRSHLGIQVNEHVFIPWRQGRSHDPTFPHIQLRNSTLGF